MPESIKDAIEETMNDENFDEALGTAVHSIIDKLMGGSDINTTIRETFEEVHTIYKDGEKLKE